MDTLAQIVQASEQVARYAVLVDAKDKNAKQFYLKYGFIPLEDQPFSLFLPIATIKEAWLD